MEKLEWTPAELATVGCWYWADGAHAYTREMWVDEWAGRRRHPSACLPPKPFDAPPDIKACACGAEVRAR